MVNGLDLGRFRDNAVLMGGNPLAAIEIDRPALQPTTLTLLFPADHRPDVLAIQAAAANSRGLVAFSISHAAPAEQGWLEVLAMGLTYAISGLAPGPVVEPDVARYFYGVDPARDLSGCAMVPITLGDHLNGGDRMMPILRVLLGLGAELSRLPGLCAIGWGSARTLMDPVYFAKVMEGWLKGGVFPALGLAGFAPDDEGELVSEGLALFAEHEIAIVPMPGEALVETTKFAVRAAHQIVHSGIESLSILATDAGTPVRSEFERNRGLLRIWRHC